MASLTQDRERLVPTWTTVLPPETLTDLGASRNLQCHPPLKEGKDRLIDLINPGVNVLYVMF